LPKFKLTDSVSIAAACAGAVVVSKANSTAAKILLIMATPGFYMLCFVARSGAAVKPHNLLYENFCR
jgi:hypothetical protein